MEQLASPTKRPRRIAFAAVMVALLALVGALGLVLRADDGVERNRASNNAVRPEVAGQPLADVSAEDRTDKQVANAGEQFAPPWPARRVGLNCSAGGIEAHWKIQTVEAGDRWECTPDRPVTTNPVPPPPPPPAPVGDQPAPAPAPAPVEQHVPVPEPQYIPPPAPEPDPYVPPAPEPEYAPPAPEYAPPPPAPAPPPQQTIPMPFNLPPLVLPGARAQVD
ncbi:hypothetical protein [Nocardia camponoti]|uniref:Uncharacterized protein n=1 Tax=Nocardia camponoti TaxID=1616106 RepID=A0A917QV88_9NOCA|nr:hypothetical protein [Nocardia camponoti]GGK69764.1 hypothetical protein GCM10011591_47410 [Nocardia camponoti]